MLSQNTLPRSAAELGGRGRIVQQRPVCLDGFIGPGDDEQLPAGLEPTLDPLVGIGHDCCPGGGQLEKATRRGRIYLGVWLSRDVQVDAAGGDDVREEIDGEVAELAGSADVAAKVRATEDEVDLGEPPARLADQLAHPVPAELVAVRVEEDVVLLLDRERGKELRVGAPEQSLGTLCAHFA